MDASGTRIDEIASGVTRLMRESGYSSFMVRRYEKAFRLLGKSCPGGVYDAEAVETFGRAKRRDGREFCDTWRRIRARASRLCAEWAATGAVDLTSHARRGDDQPKVNGRMSGELSAYMDSNVGRGLAPGTVEAYQRMALEFASYLEGQGAGSLGEADPQSVAGFAAHMSSRWPNTSSSSVASGLRPLLRHLGREDLVEALALTHPHVEHPVFEVLDAGERDRIANACVGGEIPARDSAITLMALTTGVRACDIAALTLADVDWAKMRISFTQVKTGNPVSLPMCPALAEALGRYVLEERPESARREVFLRSRPPHGPLGGHSAVYRAIASVLGTAGVDGGGARLMRRSAATGMVSSGVPMPVVSAVLGHADPETTKDYIATDLERMRACVLPLPKGAIS